ncbi:MAG: hypothetical protein U0704_02565 [Candidatus Eisenbacteria bacterium]
MTLSRPSWAGAALRVLIGLVLIAVVAAVVTWERRVAPPPAAEAPAPNEPLVLHAAAADTVASAIALTWTPDPRADEYEIEVLDSALTVLVTLGPVKSPELALERVMVPGAAAGANVWCRVVALRGGERLAESAKLATVLR